jgi:hypothetical protein
LAAGAVNGSVRNRRWKFAARDTTRARARYVAVQVGGLALLVTLANWKGFPCRNGDGRFTGISKLAVSLL